MNWISVKDRLPELGEVVLTISEVGQMRVGYIGTKKRIWVDGSGFFRLYNPTHWMPLPEPPRENCVFYTMNKRQRKLGDAVMSIIQQMSYLHDSQCDVYNMNGCDCKILGILKDLDCIKDLLWEGE